MHNLCNVPQFNALLQCKENNDGVHHQDHQNTEGLLERKWVQFQENDTVAPIPMRSEYSDRIKTKLWMGRVELCEIVDKLDLCMHVSYARLQKKQLPHIISHVNSLPYYSWNKNLSKTLRNLPPRITTGAPYAPKNKCTSAPTPKSWYIPFIWIWDAIFGMVGQVARSLFCSWSSIEWATMTLFHGDFSSFHIMCTLLVLFFHLV